MKLIKHLFITSLATLAVMPNVQAVEKTATTKQATADVNLQKFNQNVGIRLAQRAIGEQDGKKVALFVYEVQNKGKNKIQSLAWTSALTIEENKVFFTNNIDVPFKTALAAGKKETVSVVLPFEKLPTQVQQILSNKEVNIGALTVARKISFTNGTNIVVK